MALGLRKEEALLWGQPIRRQETRLQSIFSPGVQSNLWVVGEPLVAEELVGQIPTAGLWDLAMHGWVWERGFSTGSSWANDPLERVQHWGSRHVPFLWFLWEWEKEKVRFWVFFERNIFYSVHPLPSWLAVLFSCLWKKKKKYLVSSRKGPFGGWFCSYLYIHSINKCSHISIQSFPYTKFK